MMLFCMIGAHSADIGDSDTLPDGWRAVRASAMNDPDGNPGFWYENPSSAVTIYHCSNHQPTQVPPNNRTK